MKILTTQLTAILCSVCCGGVFASSVVDVKNTNAQRELFMQAVLALEEGDFKQFEQYSEQNKEYVLYPYLRFYQLRENFNTASKEDIQSFITKFKDTPLSERLRIKWLYELGEAKDWPMFLKVYSGQGGTILKCYKLQAELTVKQKKSARSALLKQAEKLWMVGQNQPKECIPLFDELAQSGRISVQDSWDRIDLAMEDGNLSLASVLSEKFNTRDKRLVSLWKKVHTKPEDAFRSRELKRNTPTVRKIVQHGIKRLARLDAQRAKAVWDQNSRRYSFSNDDTAKMQREIALRAAYQLNPDALSWLQKISGKWVNSSVREWQVRAAMRDTNWNAISQSLRQLKPVEQQQVKWQYWQARADEQLGHADIARLGYEKIAQNTNYYGFLAADRLNLPYQFNSEPVVHAEEVLKQLRNLPGMQRAAELQLLGRTTDARREWNFIANTLNHEELKSAAVLAHEWQWHDTVISTLAKVGEWGDLDLRFPLPYKDLVLVNAQTNGMDPSLIFGVARRESAFNHSARSSAGALGLMQILPGTARLQSRILGLDRPSIADLLDSDRNIQLGSAYLNSMLERFAGNQVLATAAYNAGPNRVSRWIPETGLLPADLWVETLPYRETREYVRAVLAYTTIFDWKLDNEIRRMSLRMLDVGQSDVLSQAIETKLN